MVLRSSFGRIFLTLFGSMFCDVGTPPLKAAGADEDVLQHVASDLQAEDLHIA